jgi:hypothetical protein
MTARISLTLCRPRSFVPSKINVARRTTKTRLLIVLSFLIFTYTELLAQTQEVFVDFENGIISGQYNLPNQIPPTILTESGNHFLRMTASLGDCGPNLLTTCPRTRSLVEIGWSTITSGRTVIYSWRMRIPRATNPDNQNGMVFQTFQDANGAFVGGRTMWVGILNGRLYLINRFVDGNTDCQTCGVDLGPIPYDQWMDYSLSVFLSANPSLGRMDLSINGSPAGTILGQTVFSEQEVTRMHFQLVSLNGTTSSTADYDDGRISTPRRSRQYHLDK